MSPLPLPVPFPLRLLPLLLLLAAVAQAGRRPLTATAIGGRQDPGAGGIPRRRMALHGQGRNGAQPRHFANRGGQKGSSSAKLPKVLPANYQYTTFANFPNKPYFFGISPSNTLLGVEQTTGYGIAIKWPYTTGSTIRFQIGNYAIVCGGNIWGTIVGSTYFNVNNTDSEFIRSAFGGIKTPHFPGQTGDNYLTNINGWGIASGYFYNDTSDDAVGFTLSIAEAKYSIVTLPNTTDVRVWGINDVGDLVGDAYSYDYSSFVVFVTRGSAYRLFSFGGLNTHVSAINNRGIISGYYYDTHENAHGLVIDKVWSAPVFQQVDVPGSVVTYVNGINDNGVIVGGWYDENDNGYGFKGVPTLL